MATRSHPSARAAGSDAGERRGHPRVSVNLPLSAQLDGRLVRIETDNLSEGGAYCRCDARFPVMTRLDVTLELPEGVARAGAADPVHLTAVVVRCDPHPVDSGSWNLALFFPAPEPDVREKLARYVRGRRPIDSPAY